MASRVRWGRWTRIACIAILAPIVCLIAVVRIQQYVLRWRAERLLDDIRQIQMGKSTWADAQRFMAKWKESNHMRGQCTPESCTEGVEVMDSVSYMLSHCGRYEWQCGVLSKLYAMFGARTGFASVSLSIHNGQIETSRFSLFVTVPPFVSKVDRGGSGLFASATQYHRGFDSLWLFPQRMLHPDYWLGKIGGCEGCLRFDTGYTPKTAPEEIARLTDIEFDCITRLIPCTREADLMPSAWRQYQDELPRYSSLMDDLDQCRIPLDLLAVEFKEISLVEVLSLQNAHAQRYEEVHGQFRLERVLKGKTSWPLNKALDGYAYDRGPASLRNAATNMEAGKRYIVIGSLATGKNATRVVAVDNCGLISYTPENLAAIQRGIARDALSDPN